jgi:hypothetical protein
VSTLQGLCGVAVLADGRGPVIGARNRRSPHAHAHQRHAHQRHAHQRHAPLETGRSAHENGAPAGTMLMCSPACGAYACDRPEASGTAATPTQADQRVRVRCAAEADAARSAIRSHCAGVHACNAYAGQLSTSCTCACMHALRTTCGSSSKAIIEATTLPQSPPCTTYRT